MPNLITVPVTKLTIAANIRTDTKVEKPFVTNVKQHGILVPITVVENDQDGYDVVDGQRRTLAAQQAGLDEIPALLVEKHATDAARIVDQLVVNDQRAPLTASEHVAAYQELSLFGLGVAQIARRTNTPQRTVDAALTVAKTETVKNTIGDHQIDLTHAALIAEFDDNPEHVAELTQVALEQPSQFEHAVQQMRDHVAEQKAIAVMREQIEAEGITVLDTRPSYGDKSIANVGYLYRTDENGERVRLTEEYALEHAPKDELRAYIGNYYRGPVADYFLLMPGTHGWTVSSQQKQPLTDEEREQRRKDRADKKAWESASTVRRQFLTDLAAGKTEPKNLTWWAARRAVRDLPAGTPHAIERFTHQLLSIEQDVSDYGTTINILPGYARQTPPGNAWKILLAATTATVEALAADTKNYKPWKMAELGPYLDQLVLWGYTLSEVEQQLADGGADQ